MCDLVIECDQCGETELKRKRIGRDFKMTMEGSNSFYDVKRFAKELEKLLKDTDRKDIRLFSQRSADLAKEIELISCDSEDASLVYLEEMSVLLQHLRSGGMDDLEFVCERTFSCNSIAKYDLMEVMKEIYEIAEKNEDALPNDLYLAVMLEKEILDHAFYSIYGDIDDIEYHIEDVTFIADTFEGLPMEERVNHPFVAVDCYAYIFNLLRRDGASERKLNSAAKSLIGSIKRARKAGAPIDKRVMNVHMNSYIFLMDSQKSAPKNMLKDSDIWNNEPRFKGPASVIYADHLFRKAFDDDLMSPISVMDRKTMDEILRYASEGIEMLETLDDVEGIAIWIPLAYFLKGYILSDRSLIKLALDYAEFFLEVGLLYHDEITYVVQLIATNTEIGSRLKKNAFELLGMGDFLF